MYCSGCGSELDEGARFCDTCSAKIDLETAESTSAVSRRKKGLIIAVSITVIFLILSVLVFSFVVLGSADKIRAARLCDLGARYLSELEYKEAIVAYEAAIEIDPKAEDTYIGLADAYIGLGNYEAAVQALDKGIAATDSRKLKDYRDEIQKAWDDSERRICGTVFSGGTDMDLDDLKHVGIPGVNLCLTDERGDTIAYLTDEKGYYDTGILNVGNYSLHFYIDGYMDYQCEINLSGGKYEYDVILEPDNGPEIPSDVYENSNSDFEQIIENIQQNYFDIQQSLNTFTLYETDGVYQWFIDNNAILRKAVIFPNEWSFRETTEEYYYDSDGNPSFCCVYDSAGNEMQLYFYNRLLYRFVDYTGSVMDYSDGVEPYSIPEVGEIFTNASMELHYYYGAY